MGEESAKYHANSNLPAVFGPLTDRDLAQGFKGTKVKAGKWTKMRQVHMIGAVSKIAVPTTIQTCARIPRSEAAKQHCGWISQLHKAGHACLDAESIASTSEARAHIRERSLKIFDSRSMVTSTALFGTRTALILLSTERSPTYSAPRQTTGSTLCHVLIACSRRSTALEIISTTAAHGTLRKSSC